MTRWCWLIELSLPLKNVKPLKNQFIEIPTGWGIGQSIDQSVI